MKLVTGSFGEILGIDNEHDCGSQSLRIGDSLLLKRSIRRVSLS